MVTILAAIISGLGSVFGGLFNFKGDQAKTLQGALDVVKNVDNNDATSTVALANALQVILTQGSWLERNWRSWLMMACIGCLVASFFGYVPPYFDKPLSPMMGEVFELLKIGLGGYVARRGIVDVVRLFNISSVLKTFIQKKLV